MSAARRIIRYVLDKAEHDSDAVRARVYRDLAELSPDEAQARELVAIAAGLEAVDVRSKQLRLELGDEASGNGGGQTS